MTTDTDIVIIGAGIAGAATAHHLAQLPDPPRVVLLEREATPGIHSTGRNAAIVRDVYVDPAIAPLLRDGADFIRRTPAARFERVGVMLLDVGDDAIEPHFPKARGAGQWQGECGVVDVAGLLEFYLQGADVRCNISVANWERSDDHVRVRTSAGDLTCATVVNAAGPWAGQLGGLPLQPLNRTIYCTPPLPWVDPHWCCAWHVKNGLYFRPESGGLLLSVCDERPAAPGEYTEDPELLEQLAEKLARLQPEMADVSIRSQWVGQRTFSPDRHFIIGWDPRDERVFHVAGLGGHGITASWAIGRLAADMLRRGAVACRGEPNPYTPARFLA